VAIRALAVFIREFDLVLPKCPTGLAPGAARSSIGALGWNEHDLRTAIVPAPLRRNFPAKSERLIVKYNEFTMAGEIHVQRHDLRRERLQTTMNIKGVNNVVGAALVAALCRNAGAHNGRPYGCARRQPVRIAPHASSKSPARFSRPGAARQFQFQE
jgi:hypothetical protein